MLKLVLSSNRQYPDAVASRQATFRIASHTLRDNDDVLMGCLDVDAVSQARIGWPFVPETYA
jgi:hypothetical protein